jgi:hypothetical protein
MSGFAVMSEQCSQCLMGPNKIVCDSRRREIIRDTQRKDCHFVCHKAQIAGIDAACRGHFNAFGGGQIGRISQRLGMVDFVTLPTEQPAPKGDAQ